MAHRRECCKNPSNQTEHAKFTDIGDLNGDHSCEVTVSLCRVCGTIYVDQVEFFPRTNLDIAYD